MTPHNPFAINDIYFCRQFEIEPDTMNAYGSPYGLQRQRLIDWIEAGAER